MLDDFDDFDDDFEEEKVSYKNTKKKNMRRGSYVMPSDFADFADSNEDNEKNDDVSRENGRDTFLLFMNPSLSHPFF